MKKYFLNDGTSQQGPFDIEELKAKNITAETPIWYEGLAEWTTAGKIDELKGLFVAAAPVTPVVPAPVVDEVKPVTPPPPVPAPAAAATTVAAKPAKPAKTATAGKKSTAWLSYVLGLVVLGGLGYLVYQDMEKNKTASSSTVQTTASDTSTTTQVATTNTSTTETSTADTATTPTTTTTTTEPTTTTTETEPVTTTSTTTTATTATTNNAQTAAQKAAAAKKAEEEKKKKLAAEAKKKAEADKKKLEAAQAAQAAKEKDQRNNWSKFITFGKLNYETKGEGIDAFPVPVYNGTDAVLDKVTVRIDYMKKEKKVYKSETIVLYRIPARSGLNGTAPESKKGEKVNVYITAISSRQLHFCYPQNNGNSSDPYFCN